MDITAYNDSFFFDINGYIAGIPDFTPEIDSLGPKHALKPLSPHRNLPIYEEADENVVFPYLHINLFQQIVGTLGWVALCHPGAASRHGELASYTHKPTAKAFRVAKAV